MNKLLVIVESPTKAKTISKILGDDYIVKSSLGHIRDLPVNNSYGKTIYNKYSNKDKVISNVPESKYKFVRNIGINPYDSWRAIYEILPGKEKFINEIKILANSVKHIYLATDLDREGEAIAWHLQEVIGGDKDKFRRVIFNEITQKAIVKAFAEPVGLDMCKVNAQQARRFVDRIVGYMLSPLLWKKIARGLSAGRVQSVAVKLIVERERDIRCFIPKEYWKCYVVLKSTPTLQFTAMLTQKDRNVAHVFKDIKESEIIKQSLKCFKYIANKLIEKISIIKPRAPFTTSALQRSANLHLGYSIKKTMLLAQQLYEFGYITYIRTDSTNLSKDALDMVRVYICDTFGKRYLPEEPIFYYSGKKNIQEAHEAIRPSNVYYLANDLQHISMDARKLYGLIWRQFISSQMMPLQYSFITLVIVADRFELRSSEYLLMFDGWTKIMAINKKFTQQSFLKSIEIGRCLIFVESKVNKCFTKPPSRYKEASLVKNLEKLGIGRPSTYVPIISTIKDRGYVSMINFYFYAEKIGELVTNRLIENFKELMDYRFTANMEKDLDMVATNNLDWKYVLDNFFYKFNKQLMIAEQDSEYGGMKSNNIVEIDFDCSVCGQKMGIRIANTGVFLSCLNYFLSKNRCKHTVNLIPEVKLCCIIKSYHKCNQCGKNMDSYFVNKECKLHICCDSPLCKGYIIEQGNFYLGDFDQNFVMRCERCGLNMYLKFGRYGKYMFCDNKLCKNTRTVSHDGKIAPPKETPILLPELKCKKSNAYFVLRYGRSGIFLAANTFPKSYETRAVFVEELIRFSHLLPKKLHFLLDAPIKDYEGNKTFVRFSRKENQYYVSSKKNGKMTKWSAYFINGVWSIYNK